MEQAKKIDLVANRGVYANSHGCLMLPTRKVSRRLRRLNKRLSADYKRAAYLTLVDYADAIGNVCDGTFARQIIEKFAPRSIELDS